MKQDVYLRTIPLMGTVVTIQVVGHGANPQETSEREDIVARAFEWFRQIEERCTRFDERSELMRLTAHVGVAVPASAMLFEAVQFALAVADESGGAFDPTVGHRMEMLGFNREHRSGKQIHTALKSDGPVTYRDIRLDPARKTIMLLRPLILDLGAVAKGLAVDAAARELRPLDNFSINAGGDLYLGGTNPNGESWRVGVRHPRDDGALIDTLQVSDRAVCTSGDYERHPPAHPQEHHILDPRRGASACGAASATVVALSALLADALATAAFVLGPAEGIRLLERLGVDGLIISPTLEHFATRGMYSDYKLSDSAILPDTQGPAPDFAGDPARHRHTN